MWSSFTFTEYEELFIQLVFSERYWSTYVRAASFGGGVEAAPDVFAVLGINTSKYGGE